MLFLQVSNATTTCYVVWGSNGFSFFLNISTSIVRVGHVFDAGMSNFYSFVQQFEIKCSSPFSYCLEGWWTSWKPILKGFGTRTSGCVATVFCMFSFYPWDIELSSLLNWEFFAELAYVLENWPSVILERWLLVLRFHDILLPCLSRRHFCPIFSLISQFWFSLTFLVQRYVMSRVVMGFFSELTLLLDVWYEFRFCALAIVFRTRLLRRACWVLIYSLPLFFFCRPVKQEEPLRWTAGKMGSAKDVP